MKTKKPRRFETSQQIEDEIEACKERARHKMRVAHTLDMEADVLFQHHEESELGVFKREQAKKVRHQAYRIENVRIPKLSQKLAEFKTDLLPGVITNGDRSIPRKIK